MLLNFNPDHISPHTCCLKHWTFSLLNPVSTRELTLEGGFLWEKPDLIQHQKIRKKAQLGCYLLLPLQDLLLYWLFSIHWHIWKSTVCQSRPRHLLHKCLVQIDTQIALLKHISLIQFKKQLSWINKSLVYLLFFFFFLKSSKFCF